MSITKSTRQVYRVEATVVAYVLADDEEHAERVMSIYALDEEKYNAEYWVTPVLSPEAVEPKWRDALAYHEDQRNQDVSIEAALAKEPTP